MWHIRRVNRLVLLATGHNFVDNRRHFLNESKKYLNGKTCHWVSEKFNLFHNFIFSYGKHRKRPTLVLLSYPKFPISFFEEGNACYASRTGVRNSKLQTLLSTSLAV